MEENVKILVAAHPVEDRREVRGDEDRRSSTGFVSNRATGLIGLRSIHGSSIQPGVPSSSSGGITKVCIRCCSMCIEKIRASASSSSSVWVNKIAPIASANHIA